MCLYGKSRRGLCQAATFVVCAPPHPPLFLRISARKIAPRGWAVFRDIRWPSHCTFCSSKSRCAFAHLVLTKAMSRVKEPRPLPQRNDQLSLSAASTDECSSSQAFMDVECWRESHASAAGVVSSSWPLEHPVLGSLSATLPCSAAVRSNYYSYIKYLVVTGTDTRYE